MLDTSRFSSFIAEELKLASSQVKALILGEHGDSMLPVWSSATVNGLPLAGLPACTPSFQNAVFERTKGSGAEVIKRKGGAGWAVGVAIREVIHAVLLNRQALLPVSSLVQGAYDIRDICLSVPSVVGRPCPSTCGNQALAKGTHGVAIVCPGAQRDAREGSGLGGHRSYEIPRYQTGGDPRESEFTRVHPSRCQGRRYGVWVRAPGPRSYPARRGERPARFSPEVWPRDEFGYRNCPSPDIIREVTDQGLVDIMLMSAYVTEQLAIKEGLFRQSHVTPAARANDTTDISAVRHGAYTREPSQPFRAIRN